MAYRKRNRRRMKRRQEMYKRKGRKIAVLLGLLLLVIGSVGCIASKDGVFTKQRISKAKQVMQSSGEEAVTEDRQKNTVLEEGSKNRKNSEKNQQTVRKDNTNKENKNNKGKKDKKDKERESTTNKDKVNKNQAKKDSWKENSSSESKDRIAFLGDSRTEGLALSRTYKEADFYAKCGICLNQIQNKKNFILKNGKRGNMLDALFQKEYDKIYLMFGLNELGWPYEEEFESYYESLVNQIKERYPKAVIYIQSILPVVESKGDKIFNNENIDKFNGYVEKVAERTGAVYVDVASAMKKNGGLPEDASEDGIHLKREYMEKWSEYLKENT